MKKIKIFLGGYINVSNAQNLNCLALAKYLDKNKFQVSTMSLYSGTLSIDKELKKNIKIYNCFKPFKLSRFISYTKGIIFSDISYLPKEELSLWNSFLIKFFNKKAFKTVEGIFTFSKKEESLITLINSFKLFKNLYAITKYSQNYNLINHNIATNKKILYLGTDTLLFSNKTKNINKFKNIIYIGRLFERKGIYDFLEVAKKFSSLTFHIVGEGSEEKRIKNYVLKNKLENIKFYGRLNHSELSHLLKNMDLHLFPSRSEGFPKVTLETAASGVPSLVYSDYGAMEWIDNNYNGFVVNTLDEMKGIVQELILNPTLLQNCSKNAILMAEKFDWKVLIKDWEEEILKIMEKNK